MSERGIKNQPYRWLKQSIIITVCARMLLFPSLLFPSRCVICMVEFELGEALRFLPCLHTYHLDCIDSWLMRSFTCPSCMEPVEAALLATYQTD